MTDEGAGEPAGDDEGTDPDADPERVAETAEGPEPRTDDRPGEDASADRRTDRDRADDDDDAGTRDRQVSPDGDSATSAESADREEGPEPIRDDGDEGPGVSTPESTDASESDESTAAPGEVAAEGGAADVEGDSPTEAAVGEVANDDAGDDANDDADADATAGGAHRPGVPEDVRKYDRFQKIDGSTYDRANDFLRERTYITAREWAIARLCADFRTETGVEMTKIGEHLPELVPFMTDTYTPQAVNQARAAFEEKVRKSGATFLYGAMSDFFTAEELDDVMYEATEVAKFLLEVEGVDLTVEEELEAEDTISEVMREVREHSAALRHDEVVCPECGHHIEAEDA